ncbi:unnamed protein product [Urochloa humidicola]
MRHEARCRRDEVLLRASLQVVVTEVGIRAGSASPPFPLLQDARCVTCSSRPSLVPAVSSHTKTSRVEW